MVTNNSGNFGTGTSGQVLTSNGEGVAPTFQALPASITTTQYDALSGGAGNTVVSFGPGTAGQVYQSAGAGANPAYSTATYPSTTTAGQLLYSSATNTIGGLATSAVSGSPVGSDGTNAVYLNPRQYVWIFDDLVGGLTNQSIAYGTSLGGTGANVDFNGSASLSGVTSANPGVVNLFAGSGTTSRATMRVNPSATTRSNGFQIPGGGAFSATFYVKLSAVSDSNGTYTAWIGLGVISDGSAPSDGYWFSYTNSVNSGNWVINCTNGGSNTPANTSTGIDAGNYHRLRIDGNAAGTSISFYVDDVQVANSPITTNITTNGVAPIFQIGKSAGADTKSLFVDYWSFYQKLTVSR